MKKESGNLFLKIFLTVFAVIVIVLTITAILEVGFGIGAIFTYLIKRLIAPKDNPVNFKNIVAIIIPSIIFSIALGCTKIIHTPISMISNKFFKEDRNRQSNLNFALLIISILISFVFFSLFFYLLIFGIKTN